MSRVVHVVARAVADDPHTLGVLALADALRAAWMTNRPLCSPWRAPTRSTGSNPSPRSRPTTPTRSCTTRSARRPRWSRRLASRRGPTIVADGGAPLDPLALLDLKELAAAGATAARDERRGRGAVRGSRVRVGATGAARRCRHAARGRTDVRADGQSPRGRPFPARSWSRSTTSSPARARRGSCRRTTCCARTSCARDTSPSASSTRPTRAPPRCARCTARSGVCDSPTRGRNASRSVGSAPRSRAAPRSS